MRRDLRFRPIGWIAGIAWLVAILVFAGPAAASPLSWSTPTHIEGAAGPLTGVSCPSAQFCTAVGERGEIATSTNPTGGELFWSIASLENAGFAGLSCPSASLCVGVGQNFVIGGGKEVFTSANPAGGARAWSRASVEPGPLSAGLTGVSCPSAVFCAAVGGATVFTSTNPTGGAAAWSEVVRGGESRTQAVSCPSAALCVVVGEAGDIITSTNPTSAGAWSSAHIEHTDLSGVSCPSTSLCVAVGTNTATGGGRIILTSTNPTGGASAWSLAAVQSTTSAGLRAVSCTSASFCVAVGGGDAYASTNPTGGASAWSASLNIDEHNLTAVSCPASLCAAVDEVGNVLTAAAVSAIETAEYKNWLLSGSITDKKQGQAITLPEGSTFNGHGEVNSETGAGSVSGNLSIPPFKTTIELFGILPVELGLTVSQAGSLQGTVAKSETVPGDETLTIPLKLGVGITSLSIMGLTIPTSCTTTESASLALTDNLTREELLSKGWSFTGTTTLPRFKCEGGFLGGLLSWVLSTLISGPENPYSLRFAP